MPFAFREGKMLMITKILWLLLAAGGKFKFLRQGEKEEDCQKRREEVAEELS